MDKILTTIDPVQFIVHVQTQPIPKLPQNKLSGQDLKFFFFCPCSRKCKQFSKKKYKEENFVVDAREWYGYSGAQCETKFKNFIKQNRYLPLNEEKQFQV